MFKLVLRGAGMGDGTYQCPICRTEATTEDVPGRDAIRFNCPRCGRFSMSGSAHAVMSHRQLEPRQIANASGWVREHQGIELSTSDIDFMASLRTPSVGERAAKVLVELGRRAQEIGDSFEFTFGDPSMSDWLAISWSIDARAVQYLFLTYLFEQGLVAGERIMSADGSGYLINATITPRGYEQVEQMRTGGADSAIGFCAMWFSPKLLPVWTEGIEPAIRGAGYDPRRIDRIHHNNKIDDEIVATIRRSRFIVADFTGNRGGVYFEAGFALGRDIPVVWTIRGGRLHRVHFDSRQYNFVDWSFDALPDFKSRLQNRIEATIGRGPIRQAASLRG